MKLSYNQKRILAGILAAILLFSGANYHLHLVLLGRFDQDGYILAVVVVIVYAAFLRPTRREIEEHKKTTQEQKRG